MNERNLIAAVLSSGLAPALREKGHSFQMAAEKAVELYGCMLAELAKANLPPAEPQSVQPAPVSVQRASDSPVRAPGKLETALP